MGEIVASMQLENTTDRDIASEGLRDESTVRRATVDGVVDTGAVMLVLPEDVVGRLGLRTRREVIVAYANDYRETRQVAGPVTVQIGNRFMNADCVTAYYAMFCTTPCSTAWRHRRPICSSAQRN